MRSTSETERTVLLRAPELAEHILAEWERSGSPAGSRLPTERRLAEQLGVTRTAVRNALALLEADGRISREVGRGTFVQPPRTPPRASGSSPSPTEVDGELGNDDVGPAGVMAARRIIEPRVLPLVIAWATPRDFDEMQRCLDGAAGAETREEFEAWDLALHHAIVAASHNRLLVRMYHSIEVARGGRMWGNLKLRNSTATRRVGYQDDHQEIVQALRARELTRAVAAMERHLERVENHLLSGAPTGSSETPPR